MGGAQSAEARSVSIENPSPAGVIDVSEEVVQRLKKGITKQVRENAADNSTAVPAQETRSAVKATSSSTPAATAPTPTPAAAIVPASTVVRSAPTVIYQNTPTYGGGATLTAVDVRRQKEQELQQNDAAWRQRMTDLEQNLSKTNAIMEKEYAAAVEDVRQRFAKASPSFQLPPCQDLKSQIISCYRENPRETLKCYNEVNNFQNCINSHRIRIDEN